MASYRVAEREIPADKEGYLRNLDDWSREVAEVIARAEGIALTAAHWEILEQLRSFYQQYELAPGMRPLLNHLKLHLDKSKAQSIYLLRLFPGSPAKIACKIAGLPRPANCL